jgi:hypothetical protein
MGILIKMKKEEDFTLAEGTYDAEVVSIELHDGKYGKCLRFGFRLLEDGSLISGLTPESMFPGSKTDQWVRALGIDPLKEGDELDSDILIGRRAKVLVEVATNDKGRRFGNVTKVFPLKTAQATPVSKPVKKEDIETDEINWG